MLPAVLCLSLIWALFPLSHNSPLAPLSSSEYYNTRSDDASSFAVSAFSDEAKSPVYMTAVILQGRLCLVRPETGKVEKVLDVNVRALSPEDLKLFSSGFKLYSKEDAARFIEDYTS